MAVVKLDEPLRAYGLPRRQRLGANGKFDPRSLPQITSVSLRGPG